MKRKLFFSVLIAFVCLSFLFCSLWLYARQNHTDFEQLCRYSAMRSHSRFCDYRDEGSTYDYHYGVSEFVSFYNSYMSLVTADSGQTDVNCIYLNQLIGRLMYFPELTDDQVGQLVSITAILSEDIYDENAYNQMFSLFNSMGI